MDQVHQFDEKDIIDTLRKIIMMRDLANNINNKKEEIKNLLSKNVNLSIPSIPFDIRIEVKQAPSINRLMLTFECTEEKRNYHGYFDGSKLYLLTSYGATKLECELRPLSVESILELYALEKCSPGILDYIINELQKKDKVITERLEMLKKIVAMIETLLK